MTIGKVSKSERVKVYNNQGCSKLGVGTKELCLYKAEALTALQGLPGVLELHQVTTEAMPPSLVMSHQSGKLLQDYFDIDDTLSSLLPFID